MYVDDLKNIINKTIMSNIVKSLNITEFLFKNKESKIIMDIISKNKSYEYELIDFNSYLVNHGYDTFISKYIEFFSKINKDIFNNNTYIHSNAESFYLKSKSRLTHIFDDNNHLLLPDEGELAFIDTKAYLSDHVSVEFWENGGIDEMIEKINAECPNIVVATYKGKYFYLYRRLPETYIEEDIEGITIDEILDEIIYRTVDLREQTIKDKAEILAKTLYGLIPENIEKEKYEELMNSYKEEIIIGEINRVIYVIDRFKYWNYVSKEEIQRQTNKAIEIITNTKNDLLISSAIDLVVYGYDDQDLGIMFSLNDFINDSIFIPDEYASSFIGEISDHFHMEGIKRIEDLEFKPKTVLNDIIEKNYIIDNTLFVYKDLKIDFYKNANNYLNDNYKNIEIIFDKDKKEFYLHLKEISKNIKIDVLSMLFGFKQLNAIIKHNCFRYDVVDYKK